MKRMVIYISAMALAALLCACAVGADAPPASTAAPSAEGPVPGASTAEPSGGRDYTKSISYIRAEQEYGDSSFISYPYIMEAEFDSFNVEILTAIRQAMDEAGVPTYVRCSVTCNDCGIFSLRITVSDLATNETLAVIPLTFGVEEHAPLAFADLFDPENERWRGLVPDIVMLQAEKAKMNLICDVMPASDTQLYYVAGDSLVILYRPYEIAANSEGWPEFAIPLAQLMELLRPGSALMRLAERG